MTKMRQVPALVLLANHDSQLDSDRNCPRSKCGDKSLRLVVRNQDENNGDVPRQSLPQEQQHSHEEEPTRNLESAPPLLGALMMSGEDLVVSDDTSKSHSVATESILDDLFFDGYTSKRVTNLIELRDALNQYFPPSSIQSAHQNLSEQNDDYNTTNNDDSEGIIRSTSERFFTYGQEKEVATMDEIRRFELFRSVIEHEDDLLNHRVSCIILAQSFLMAAFITTNDSNEDQSQQEQLNALRLVTAGVGLLTVAVTLPAILAAGSNIEVQQQVYFRQIDSDERCLVLHGHYRDLFRFSASHKSKNSKCDYDISRFEPVQAQPPKYCTRS